MRNPISLASGGGGNRPSRIACIASKPDIAIAARATGPGSCHSMVRLRVWAGANNAAGSGEESGCCSVLMRSLR